jgi:hypothetical protein
MEGTRMSDAIRCAALIDIDGKGGDSREVYLYHIAMGLLELPLEDRKALALIPEYLGEHILGKVDTVETGLFDWPDRIASPDIPYAIEAIENIGVSTPEVAYAVNIFKSMAKDHFPLWDYPRLWVRYLPRAGAILDEFYTRWENCRGQLPVEVGYIYFLEAGPYIKIGKSINPDQRLKQISPKMPFDCEFKEIFPSMFMSLAEKLLHEKFKKYRVNGEWFDFGDDRDLVEDWIDADAREYIEVAYFSLLHDRLWRLPEVRIASLFDPEVAFDTYENGWKVYENFKRLADESGRRW